MFSQAKSYGLLASLAMAGVMRSLALCELCDPRDRRHDDERHQEQQAEDKGSGRPPWSGLSAPL